VGSVKVVPTTGFPKWGPHRGVPPKWGLAIGVPRGGQDGVSQGGSTRKCPPRAVPQGDSSKGVPQGGFGGGTMERYPGGVLHLVSRFAGPTWGSPSRVPHGGPKLGSPRVVHQIGPSGVVH
jgi:hypothetical protein